MIKPFSVIAFIALFIGSLAASADVTGRYSSEGMDARGLPFKVTAEIEMLRENVCRIKWSDGFEGICMIKGSVLSVGYLMYGKPALGVYEVNADGTITGSFIDDYHGGGIAKNGKIGTEKMVPLK